jgi:penicillin G amidase
MEVNRRSAWGRLSEVFGESGLAADELFRTFGLGRAAEREEASLDAQSRRWLQAYADGVNAYATGQGNSLPWEFRVLLLEFEPWRPVDSLAWGKMLAWQLGANWSSQLMRAVLLERFTPQQVAELMPSVPPSVVPELAVAPADVVPPASLLRRLQGVTDLVRPAVQRSWQQ